MKPEPNDPMVCITHLHALLEGQNCEGEEEQEQKQEDEEEEQEEEQVEEQEEEQVEKCKLCGATFQSKRELLSHLKVHKSKKILEENQLGSSEREVKKSEEKAKAKQRQKRKHSLGPILCPNCGSSFNSKTLVTRHQRYAQGIVKKIYLFLTNL